MMICGRRFNIILWLTLGIAVSFLCACQSPEKKQLKQETSLRVHLENPYDRSDRTQKVPVWRADPVMINIEKQAFLTEYNVKEAKVVDTMGGFLISIQMDQQGSYLLENYSSASYGKRFAIFVHFDMDTDKSTNYMRWLAAPKISSRISDGILTFTPDASREESLNIVLGLNNVARKIQKGIKW
jgi:hypothetical protein